LQRRSNSERSFRQTAHTLADHPLLSHCRSRDKIPETRRKSDAILTHLRQRDRDLSARTGRGSACGALPWLPELSYSWRHQIPAIAAVGFRVVAPDMRGFGRTSAHADSGDGAGSAGLKTKAHHRRRRPLGSAGTRRRGHRCLDCFFERERELAAAPASIEPASCQQFAWSTRIDRCVGGHRSDVGGISTVIFIGNGTRIFDNTTAATHSP
jgi:hypothetical protein